MEKEKKKSVLRNRELKVEIPFVGLKILFPKTEMCALQLN